MRPPTLLEFYLSLPENRFSLLLWVFVNMLRVLNSFLEDAAGLHINVVAENKQARFSWKANDEDHLKARQGKTA